MASHHRSVRSLGRRQSSSFDDGSMPAEDERGVLLPSDVEDVLELARGTGCPEVEMRGDEEEAAVVAPRPFRHSLPSNGFPPRRSEEQAQATSMRAEQDQRSRSLRSQSWGEEHTSVPEHDEEDLRPELSPYNEGVSPNRYISKSKPRHQQISSMTQVRRRRGLSSFEEGQTTLIKNGIARKEDVKVIESDPSSAFSNSRHRHLDSSLISALEEAGSYTPESLQRRPASMEYSESARAGEFDLSQRFTAQQLVVLSQKQEQQRELLLQQEAHQREILLQQEAHQREILSRVEKQHVRQDISESQAARRQGESLRMEYPQDHTAGGADLRSPAPEAHLGLGEGEQLQVEYPREHLARRGTLRQRSFQRCSPVLEEMEPPLQTGVHNNPAREGDHGAGANQDIAEQMRLLRLQDQPHNQGRNSFSTLIAGRPGVRSTLCVTSAEFVPSGRRFVNQNGVPYTEINCSVRIMLIPLDADLGNMLALLGHCGRIRSIEFTHGSTADCKTALVIFTEPHYAQNLIDRFAFETVRLGEHALRGLFGMVHLYSMPQLRPEQSRVLLVSGRGDALLLGPMLGFLKARVPAMEVLHVDISPYSEVGGIGVWELYFSSIDEQSARVMEVLETDPYYGQVLHVEYGTDPCEHPLSQVLRQ